ncbi:MAG: LytTR family DNA-binding domain-containing protein [Cytophagales bacterium]|nr:LytTR family DNA-binding domain-containing protein [Cytophagales bacterium]
MSAIPLLDNQNLDQRKLFRYSVVYLFLTAIILMIQNYIRYGGHSSYDPGIGGTYLMVSVLGFIPVVLLVHKSLDWFSNWKVNHYWTFAAILGLLIIVVFFILSNIILHVFGYFEGWVDMKYASWYFGKEALIHGLLLAGNFFFLQERKDDQQKVISANHGRKEITIKADLIEWIEADDHYLKIHLADQSLIKRTTLEKMADELQPDFVRIHRKYLVNKQEIIGKEKSGRDEYVVMKTGTKVKVGRSYQPLEVLKNT